MSVIYRSLQQLKKDEAERGSRKTPQAVAPRLSKIVGRALIFLLIFAVLAGSGVYFIQQEVQKIPLPAEPDLAQVASVPASVKEVKPEEPKEQEVKQLVSLPVAPPIVKQRLFRPIEESKQAPIDLTKPSKALEKHFATRARKNETVLSLERKLIQSSRQGDLGQSKELLTNMTRELGKKESATKYKWEGYLALKEKRYADAENFFRRAVSLRPTDYVSNINLVYALLGQGKREEALRIYRALIERYPMNERVQKLGKALGEL